VTTAFTGNILTTTLSASGNVTGSYILGNGSQLTGIAASGTASNITSGTSNVNIVSSGGNVSVGVNGIANLAVFDTAGNTTITGNLLMTGNIIPTANNVYALGAPAMQWKEVYIGPGSLYINGQEVLSSSAENIVVSANANQNLALQTSGSGGIRINPTGNGIIQVQGPLQITAGKNITSSDGNAIQFSNPVAVNNLTSQTLNNNLTLSANGTGVVSVTSILSTTGNINSSANISGANVLGTAVIGTTLSATANVIGGNVTTAGIGNIGTLAVTGTTRLTGNTTAGHMLPAANVSYDLGSATAQWRTIYVSGNTINMGGATIQTDAGSGSFAFVPPATASTPNPTGVVFGPGGNISTVTTTAGTITANLQLASSTTSTILKVTSIGYPGDDTAADPAGGQTITLTGSGFMTGAQVLIGTSPMSTAGSVTVVSPVTITFVSPAGTVGNWPVYVVNSDGATAISLPGIAYSGTPTWLTASGNIAQVYEVSALSTTISATGDVPIGYSIYSGSLPSGTSLNGANGLISGTTVATASSTTYSFTARATDAQQQDTNRAFTITVNPDVVTWSSPAANSTSTLTANAVMSNVTMSATSAAGFGIVYTANSLPTGVSIIGANIVGTPTVTANTSSLLTATANTSGRTSTRVVNWAVQAVTTPPTVEYLVVAGGGGGASGGGGAGGYLTATGLAVSPSVQYWVTVGAGGTGGSGGSTALPTSGGNSVFAATSNNASTGTIVAVGGGAGSRIGDVGAPGALNGGSGGGGGAYSGGTTTGGSGTAGPPIQGYAGGGNNGNTPAPYPAGGGGGAGGTGYSAPGGSTGGAGGIGLSSSISGSMTTYAGGGGGSVYAGGTGGAGGSSVGGAGSSTSGGSGGAGTVNTGSGGGGGSSGGTGGAGGSGIVIIRYSDSYAAATSTTGSPTITVAGGYRVYKWTTVGGGSITF
jgi:hypothetical protein